MSNPTHIDEIKNNLNLELNINYNNLVTFLNRIPMPQIIRQHTYQNLDQGIDWARKGINSLELQVPNPQPTEALSNGEIKKEAEADKKEPHPLIGELETVLESIK